MKKAPHKENGNGFKILCKTKVCWIKIGAVLFAGIVLGLFLSGANLDYDNILHMITLVLLACILGLILDVRNTLILEA